MPHIHYAQLRFVAGRGWYVRTIRAHPGDIIIWKFKRPFSLWFPTRHGPFIPDEILIQNTKLFGGPIPLNARPGKYTYTMYLPTERNPIFRWVKGNTPPTIIIW
jgi:hypothetical protein